MENALILIVDDDPGSRETLSDLLSTEPYQVQTVVNGEELFDLLEHITPDVILLDVMMPRMNGFEVCRRLKESSRWQQIPVVLITALNSRPSLLKGLEAGADEFLSKPVSGPELRARVRNMARIKRQYDDLQATIQLQEDLVRLAVHDMRTPLTTILLHTNKLLLKNRTDSDRWSLDVIDSETRRLDNFIDDLLILIRQDEGNLRLNRSEVDVCQMIREAVMESELVANTAGVNISLSLPVNPRRILLDANLFRRVIDNLLSNAIKQSPADGTIVVSATDVAESDLESPTTRQGFLLSISDEGAGVPPEHREKIFEMVEIVSLKRSGFSRSDIGLAFCKLVVSEHFGDIYVTDNLPKGSVFVVEI
ncbi:MAG: response regulator [Candidatus Promineifilaceae bacterium]